MDKRLMGDSYVTHQSSTSIPATQPGISVEELFEYQSPFCRHTRVYLDPEEFEFYYEFNVNSPTFAVELAYKVANRRHYVREDGDPTQYTVYQDDNTIRVYLVPDEPICDDYREDDTLPSTTALVAGPMSGFMEAIG